MEALVVTIAAIGKIVSSVVWSIAAVYIVGLITKTFLIFNGDADAKDLDSWMDFLPFRKKEKKNTIDKL